MLASIRMTTSQGRHQRRHGVVFVSEEPVVHLSQKRPILARCGDYLVTEGLEVLVEPVKVVGPP